MNQIRHLIDPTKPRLRREMMKKLLVFLCVIVFIFSFSGTSSAVQLYVDSAPNVYGSPAWAPWWSQTKSDVVAGTFTNMRTGSFPGTTKADPYDEIVYSTMDLGKRLHWIYWLSGETIANLTGKFEVEWVIDWGGTAYTQDSSGWTTDLSLGWSQPENWEDYSGGVIGSLGFAWWAGDDDAPPPDTGGTPWDETNQADIDAMRQQVLDYQTYATGYVRIDDGNGGWDVFELNVDIEPVPEPATMLLLGSGLVGLAGFRRKKFKK
jgi:hypothetical protein